MDVESVSNSKVKIFEALNARREKLKTVKAAGLRWKKGAGDRLPKPPFSAP